MTTRMHWLQPAVVKRVRTRINLVLWIILLLLLWLNLGYIFSFLQSLFSWFLKR